MYETLDIITIGESLIEFSSEKSLLQAENFSKYYGGDTLSVAIAALRSGSKVGYITKVKNDSFGEYLLDCWQSEGLDSSQVKFSDLQNGVYFCGLKNGEVEMEFYRKKTAASRLDVSDIDFNYIKSSKFIFATGFVQSLSLNCREVVKEVFKFAKNNGILTGYYPNFRHTDLLEPEAREMFLEIKDYIDYIFINVKDNIIFDTNSPDNLIAKLHDIQIHNAVIIKNHDGIYVTNGTETNYTKTLNVDTVDITGNTSAIIGAFISSKLQGNSDIEAIKYANVLGAMQASKLGAIKSIPKKNEVYDLMRRFYE